MNTIGNTLQTLQAGTPLLRTLEGHSLSVQGLAVSEDGRRAISASEDYTLRVWDLETGRTLRILAGHTASVERVAMTRTAGMPFPHRGTAP